MRKIKIFLASSLVEFAQERMEIENFIRNVSDQFEDRYNIKIQPLLCENLDPAYTKGRKQEEYNEEIRQSELCFFIFFTKAGQYTVEEFEVARAQYEATGKPKIYTYFKELNGASAEQSLYDFMEMLGNTLQHYYNPFHHLDTVKLRILLSLKLEEMDFIELKLKNGECTVDGKGVLSVDHVAEFANNLELSELKKQLQQAEAEYGTLKPLYQKGEREMAFLQRYSKVLTQRAQLISKIEALRERIFDFSLCMVRDCTEETLTPRQMEAYRLFESGDYEGGIAAYNTRELDDEFQQELQKIERAQQQLVQMRLDSTKRYIRQYKTLIRLLSMAYQRESRFEEMTECFEKIVPLALKEQIELDAVAAYIAFLSVQEQFARAKELGEALCRLYEARDEISDQEKRTLYEQMASLNQTEGLGEEAEEYAQKAYEVLKRQAEKEPDQYRVELAEKARELALFYIERDQSEKAEAFYFEAMEILKAFIYEDPEQYGDDLINLYNEVADYYQERQPEESGRFYEKAADLFPFLDAKIPEKVDLSYAAIFHNGAVFHFGREEQEQATEYAKKATAILEKLESGAVRSLQAVYRFDMEAFLEEADPATEGKMSVFPELMPASYEPTPKKEIEIMLANQYYLEATLTLERETFEKAYHLAARNPDEPLCKSIMDAVKKLF